MQTRVRARVRGLVQGVFFRASTRDRARELGLCGWVRNCDDGSVELEAEGSRAAVEKLVAWAQRGPGQARVDEVEVQELAPQGSERGFHVRP